MEKEKKIKIAKIILKTVAVAGVLSMAVLAPNALQILGPFYGRKEKRYNPKYYLETAVSRLKKHGLIKFQKQNDKTFIRLTPKGEEELLRYQLQEITIKKPEKWDGKWRLIIFDIKEKRRRTRNLLRQELINFGFLKLQNSVWIYPYNCEEIAVMLKAYFHLGKDVLYITAEKIENDGWLRQKFNL